MAQDFLGQELTPGDVVVVQRYRGLYPGIFVKYNGNFHVQTHWLPNEQYTENMIATYRRLLEEYNTGQRTLLRIGQVSWTSNSRRIAKINPDGLPDSLRELLNLTRELCIIKRKIR